MSKWPDLLPSLDNTELFLLNLSLILPRIELFRRGFSAILIISGYFIDIDIHSFFFWMNLTGFLLKLLVPNEALP